MKSQLRMLARKIKILLYVGYAGFAVIGLAAPVHASPFGQGVFNANIGFGSATSLSVAVSGNVALNLASDGTKYSASGSHVVTVTSSDVVGYSLYAYAVGSSAMSSGSDSIPASSNSTAAALSTNTWGYNLDGSSNYLGMSTTPSLIKTSTGSNLSTYKAGEPTTVTYGVVTDLTKPAGSYVVNVVYTASCLSQ